MQDSGVEALIFGLIRVEERFRTPLDNKLYWERFLIAERIERWLLLVTGSPDLQNPQGRNNKAGSVRWTFREAESLKIEGVHEEQLRDR